MFKCIFLNENMLCVVLFFVSLFKFHCSLFPWIQLTIYSSIHQVMVCHLIGAKPFTEPLMVFDSSGEKLQNQWCLATYAYTGLSENLLFLTHWGRVTHLCISKLTIIDSDNGLLSGRHQTIIWTNAGILLIRTLGTNFRGILGEIHTFSFKKMHLKMSSTLWSGCNFASASMCWKFVSCAK